ncbi:MAG: hypothetical protein C5B59_16360 [Bacteroidetes bacterium]|nr:MAG: hypothetical protein C5B59_16360 [Bacteroidota bacterium]
MKWLLVSFLVAFFGKQCLAQEKPPVQFGKISKKDFELPPSPVIDSNTNGVVIADVGNTEFVGSNDGWFRYVYKRKTRILVLNKKGFDLANIQVFLYINSEKKESLEDVKASSYTLESGKITETSLNKNEVYEDRHDKNHIVKKFTVPGIREGSLIEYSYTVKSDFYFNIPEWEFQYNTAPCLWSDYQVKIPLMMNYVSTRHGYDNYYIHNTNTGRATYHVTNTYDNKSLVQGHDDLSVAVNTIESRWVMKDVPALNISESEKYITTPENYRDKIEFQLSQVYNGDEAKNVMTTWTQATDELLKSEDFGQPISQENPWLDGELKKIVGNETDPLQQARKIYYFVASQYTCNNHSISGIRTSLKEVYKKREGCVGEINLLLIAMLRVQGIQADPVLLGTRDHGYAPLDYPVMKKYNYTICRTRIDGKDYLLDASVPIMGFGKLPLNCYNGFGRTINARDTSIINLNADDIKEQEKTTVLLINDAKEFLSGRFEVTPGYYESRDWRAQINKSSQKEFFKNFHPGEEMSPLVENQEIDSLENLEQPIKVQFDFNYKPWTSEIVYFSPMVLETSEQNPFVAVQRKYPVELSYPYDKLYVLNMEVPAGYTVDELPKSVKVLFNQNQGFFEYIIEKDNNNNIQLRTHVFLHRTRYEPSEYNALREFFGYVTKKQSEQIVFKKKK